MSDNRLLSTYHFYRFPMCSNGFKFGERLSQTRTFTFYFLRNFKRSYCDTALFPKHLIESHTYFLKTSIMLDRRWTNRINSWLQSTLPSTINTNTMKAIRTLEIEFYLIWPFYATEDLSVPISCFFKKRHKHCIIYIASFEHISSHF